LVRRKVAVIATPGYTQSALVAKAATQTIPIVFLLGSDPVEIGLVASLNRPGGNLTGVSMLNTEFVGKLFEMMHELVPAATSIALLVNPTNPSYAAVETRDALLAARVRPSLAGPERESPKRDRSGLREPGSAAN
jgi:putative ABC transport system substrate-binding protein